MVVYFSSQCFSVYHINLNLLHAIVVTGRSEPNCPITPTKLCYEVGPFRPTILSAIALKDVIVNPDATIT